MKRHSASLCPLVALTVVLLGCTRPDAVAERELVVLCGSSFLPPGEELCSRFTSETGVSVSTTAAGSEDFLPLVKSARQGDILITHDPYLDYVRDAGALADYVEVGFVAPVLAVQKGNPKQLKTIEDLAKPGIRVALSNPEYSTCGEMVFRLLEKKGIKDAVLRNVGNRLTKGHGNLATMLVTDAVDAVVMWNGVANTRKDKLDVIPTPYEYDSEVRVYVIGLKYSRHPALVAKFLDFTRMQGRKLFESHGYVK